jgi:hypothetical protein
MKKKICCRRSGVNESLQVFIQPEKPSMEPVASPVKALEQNGKTSSAYF